MIRKALVSTAATLALVAGSAAPSHASTNSPTLRAVIAPLVTECRSGYYKNVDGICVHRPGHNPKGATAKCRDGTYSYSKHASGTCSGHGGVARWIHHP